MKQFLFWLLLIFNITFCFSQTEIRNLNKDWQFRFDSSETWMPASVPGSVITDIFKNGIIPDPYASENESLIRKLENHGFVYRLNFNIDPVTLNHDSISVIFHGIDTYCDVFLNKQKILSAGNMFRIFKTEVKSFLQNGSNELVLVFHPAMKTASDDLKKWPYKLPADSDKGEEKTSIFTRKAPYHYGWDFSPRFAFPAIWKKIELLAWSNARIENVFVNTVQANEQSARVKIYAEFSCSKKEKYHFILDGFHTDQHDIDTILELKPGRQIIEKVINISHPKLWWPQGLGDANLYPVKFKLLKRNKAIDSLKLEAGIRTVRLEQQKDSIGESFRFYVNDKPIFAKGANLVPPDMFMSQVDSNRYATLVELASGAHFNMLRIWGGGVYGDDEFFRLCDHNGILVWQDFMFACSFYPIDQQKLDNIKAEAIDNIIRLRNHASLALWCGNNEIDEAWHNWGYQKAYGWSLKDSADIWQQYETLFKQELPSLVNSFDPGRNYISTSPSFGWGRAQSMTYGDSHYWGIWWGMQDFSVYREKTGRFMSEYGFQALPDKNTIDYFAPGESDISKGSLLAHQKHPTGFQTINEYMKREFDIPQDFSDYIYLSQILQAKGLGIAFRAHRMNPRCDGTLYWQFNDCWPGISWSSVDYFGRPKALYYEAKRCFSNYLPVFEVSNDSLNILLLSDSDLISDSLQLTLFNVNGSELWKSVTLPKKHNNRTFSAGTWPLSFFIDKGNADEIILLASMKNDKEKRQIFSFVPIRKLKLELPEIKVRNLYENNQIITVFSSNKPALYVHPEFENDFIAPDDFFMLFPGFEVKIPGGKLPVLGGIRMLNTLLSNPVK